MPGSMLHALLHLAELWGDSRLQKQFELDSRHAVYILQKCADSNIRSLIAFYNP